MNQNINTGGSAFPMQEPQAIHSYAMAQVEGITDADERDRAYTAARAQAVGGMTLRDYFAAKAMQLHGEMLSNMAIDGEEAWDEYIAKRAYKTADAMLKARGQA